MTWKTSTKASDGQAYEFYQQEKVNQCGPASICTFINLTQKKKLSVDIVGRWHIEGEGVTLVNNDMIRDFGLNGSWYSGTIAALEKQNVNAHATKGYSNAAKWVIEGGKYKPAILSIGWYAKIKGRWQRNGGHWVVAVKVEAGKVICLDSGLATGIVEMDVSKPNLYKVNYGSGDQEGLLDGIILP